MPRGNGFLRFLLRYNTAATTRIAAPAAPTTMPALAPAVRPELEDLSESLLEEDELVPVGEEEDADDVSVAREAPVPVEEASLAASEVAAA